MSDHKKHPLNEEELESVAGGGGFDPSIITTVVQTVSPMLGKGGLSIPGMGGMPNVGMPQISTPSVSAPENLGAGVQNGAASVLGQNP